MNLLPQQVFERAIVEGELDPFDFVLAESLKMTLDQMRQMPNNEYLQWRAFFVWRAAQLELESKKGSTDG